MGMCLLNSSELGVYSMSFGPFGVWNELDMLRVRIVGCESKGVAKG